MVCCNNCHSNQLELYAFNKKVSYFVYRCLNCKKFGELVPVYINQ